MTSESRIAEYRTLEEKVQRSGPGPSYNNIPAFTGRDREKPKQNDVIRKGAP